MIALLCAFQFLTIIPPIIRRNFTPLELGRSVGLYPIVGLAVGGMLYILRIGLEHLLPAQLTAVILLGIWLIITRGLHFDGFLDTCDGLFGAFTPEKRLEIMHDPRVGAFGVAGGVLLLLAKFDAIISLQNTVTGLILAPVFGRFIMSNAIVLFPYAREKGLGKDIKDNARWQQLLLALLISIGSAWFMSGWMGLLALFFIIVIANLWLLFVIKRIPGLTGDIYGATCEMVEVFTLIIFTFTIH